MTSREGGGGEGWVDGGGGGMEGSIIRTRTPGVGAVNSDGRNTGAAFISAKLDVVG